MEHANGNDTSRIHLNVGQISAEAEILGKRTEIIVHNRAIATAEANLQGCEPVGDRGFGQSGLRALRDETH
ncbi:hypothetical protein [Maricaulis sp.]|uniref:hypothetical protein n=1 Tax=Maricaulis sp. TaxID=1486257 RepID=UPI0025C02250|nr:hypothetical protein [Maricaulis sp.]